MAVAHRLCPTQSAAAHPLPPAGVGLRSHQPTSTAFANLATPRVGRAGRPQPVPPLSTRLASQQLQDAQHPLAPKMSDATHICTPKRRPPSTWSHSYVYSGQVHRLIELNSELHSHSVSWKLVGLPCPQWAVPGASILAMEGPPSIPDMQRAFLDTERGGLHDRQLRHAPPTREYRSGTTCI